MKAERIVSSTHQVTGKAINETGLRICPVGSVLVVVRSGILAHSLPVAITDVPVTINQDLKAFYSDEPFLNDWLALFLRSSGAALLRSSRRDGTTVQSIQYPLLKDTLIPIPPIDQRKQIIDILEKALNKRSTSLLHVVSARHAIERFRQSVLTAACTGKLTADWRTSNESSSVKEALEKRRAAESVRLGKKYRSSFQPNPETLQEIPGSWLWVALPELGELGRGKSKHRPRNDPKLYGGEFPFIQTGDIARSGGHITSHSQTYNDAGLAQSRLWPEGTVCITIAANIADSGLLTFPACFPDSVVGLITDETIVSPEYAELFIRTARRDLAMFAPATAQANINLAILSGVAVAIPPIEEQREIIRRTDRCFRAADTLLNRIDQATRGVDRSSQALLEKAFRGELLVASPQEVEDVGADGLAK